MGCGNWYWHRSMRHVTIENHEASDLQDQFSSIHRLPLLRVHINVLKASRLKDLTNSRLQCYTSPSSMAFYPSDLPYSTPPESESGRSTPYENSVHVSVNVSPLQPYSLRFSPFEPHLVL